MKKKITVDKALTIHNRIDNAVLLCVFIFSLAAFILSINYAASKTTAIMSVIILIVCILILIALYIWLSPAFHIWKFWAFRNVENVHELKKRLIIMKHVSEESAFFKRIENSFENEKKYWELRLRFAKKEIFEDDKTVPEETVIYYSKLISVVIILSVTPMFLYGVLLLVMSMDEKEPIIALLGIIFLTLSGILCYYFGFKRLINKEPQLIINDKGISTKKLGFHKWEEIEECEILTGNQAMFRYRHSEGYVGVSIQELNIKNNGIKLSKLLVIYKERNKLQNNKGRKE